MRKITVLALIFVLLLVGCTVSEPVAENGSEEIDLSGGEPSAYEEVEKEAADGNLKAQDGEKFDIRFIYHNDIYGYNLEATWSDVLIKKTNTNGGSEVYGLELLFDDSIKMFGDMDVDDSGTLSKNEWIELEADISFKSRDLDSSGAIEYVEFYSLTHALGGIDVYPTGFKITQPTHESYALELNNDEGPVSIKILRASTAGFTGMYNYYFPEATVFVELSSDFEIFVPEAGDMSATVAFDYPLLNMYVDDAKEVKDSYSHGSHGFTSVVDTKQFNGIFEGESFSLQYEAYYEGKVVGTYDLIITPRN